MTATVLPGSDGQACWRSTITDGQHKNRQILTAAGRPRLAAATLHTVTMALRHQFNCCAQPVGITCFLFAIHRGLYYKSIRISRLLDINIAYVYFHAKSKKAAGRTHWRSAVRSPRLPSRRGRVNASSRALPHL